MGRFQPMPGRGVPRGSGRAPVMRGGVTAGGSCAGLPTTRSTPR
jgi:hypothetical protein